jgi:hypothetical protein
LRENEAEPCLKRAFGFAALFTLAELFLCLIVAPSRGTPQPQYNWSIFPDGWNESIGQSNAVLYRYQRLSNWDSYHYFSAAKNNYSVPDGEWTGEKVTNRQIEFSFLPAFPFFGKALSWLTSLPLELALPLAAQIACFSFYVLFFLILRRLCEFPESTALMIMALFSVLPGAFYLVVPYSESIFLFSVAGVFFFSEQWVGSKPGSQKILLWSAALICAWIATWSRMLGVTIALFPIFLMVRKQLSVKDRIAATALGGLSVCGTLAYFYFCQLCSGHWDAYFRLAKIGWGIQASYLHALNPFLYVPRFFFEDGEISLQRFLALFCIVFFAAAITKDSDRRRRMSYYAAGLSLFYLTVAGKADMELQGMIRYVLPVIFIGIIPISIVFRDRVIHLLKPGKVLFFLITVLFVFEIVYSRRYMHNLWVS